MYGSGSINGFLTILNPAASDDRLNLLKQLEASRADADRVSEYFSTLVLTDCFPAFAQEMYPWPEPEFVPAGPEPRRF